MDKRVTEIVRELYSSVAELEELFPGRKFTLDGHLVGSLGEVIAAYRYDLELFPTSSEQHDAKASNGKLVQIKATQVNQIGIRSEPEHLIVLKLKNSGDVSEIYNGPGSLAWASAGKMQKNGQRSLAVKKLEKLMQTVPMKERLPFIKT